MMATRRLNRRQTNMVLAGAMGFALALAVAFFVVAMPEDVFEGLILATGLPSVLASAQPPLGETARLAVAILSGGVAGIAVIGLFLVTGRQPRRKAETVRPFSASGDIALELDEPIPAVERENVFIPESAPEAETPATPAFIPLPVAEEKPIEIEIPVESPPSAEKIEDAPIFLDFKAMRAATQPANDAPALDLGEWKVAEPAPEPEQAKPSRPITAPAQIAEDEPISALMQRLEAGLQRRTAQGEALAQPPVINRSGVGLRSTLDELRKMAVRR